MTSLDAFHIAERTLTILLPELLIVFAAITMMTAGAFLRLPRRVWWGLSVAILGAALVVLCMLWNFRTDPYGAIALNDALARFSRLGFLAAGFVILGLAHDQVDDARAAEFFGCLLLIQSGAMLVATANELIFLFVGLELVSIPTYLLLYLPKRTPLTQEAATKYFYLSIFSSGLMLFGMAYLYGLTGVTNLKALAYILHNGTGITPLAFGLIAVVFMMAGFGFRVAAVPFHFYAPDVYQGSPTVIAALLAWVPKGIGFLAMLRALTAVVGGPGELGQKAIALTWVLAVVTMTLGNTVALLQQDLKRLLAYSSIAHAGYLLIGVAVAFRDGPGATGSYLGAQGIIFYLAAYALMTLGAFGVILSLRVDGRPVETVEEMAGLGRTRPILALAMAFCLFSLAGVPPLAGFWGKFWIFAAALSGEGPEARMLQVLAVIGVLNAAVGAYYYLRIVVVMYLRDPGPQSQEVAAEWPAIAAVATCALLSLLLGIMPEPIRFAAHESALALGAQPEPRPLPARPEPEATAAVDLSVVSPR